VHICAVLDKWQTLFLNLLYTTPVITFGVKKLLRKGIKCVLPGT